MAPSMTGPLHQVVYVAFLVTQISAVFLLEGVKRAQ